jgi:hypothetical protein
VPNGNQTVTITTDRARPTAPVVANVYYATGLHAIRPSRFTTTAEGEVTIEEQRVCAVAIRRKPFVSYTHRPAMK